jgi:hypothetical protein
MFWKNFRAFETCVVGKEDYFGRGVCVVYTKEEKVLKKCDYVLCVIFKNGNMVKELIVVLCACILLGGVKNGLVKKYTKVVTSYHIIFTFLLKQKVKRYTQVVAFGISIY